MYAKGDSNSLNDLRDISHKGNFLPEFTLELLQRFRRNTPFSTPYSKINFPLECYATLSPPPPLSCTLTTYSHQTIQYIVFIHTYRFSCLYLVTHAYFRILHFHTIHTEYLRNAYTLFRTLSLLQKSSKKRKQKVFRQIVFRTHVNDEII